MGSQDRVDVLADIFNFKFTTYSVAYVNNHGLRELTPPTRVSKMALGVEESDTNPTLVRNKLM